MSWMSKGRATYAPAKRISLDLFDVSISLDTLDGSA
jgi:hypothetical protein